ncbi:MAG: riboflavin biosynthesis protein RibF [SAR324 cluster bacterium]|uniref:Riboflavin biosynthesis protein n=1 Tax=SAR324 cluster bacterium TaxID=2024889 RepID=A0A2A4T8F4_9DELT|nr:MAG: riboflavin biosynthesis protein RibF [SAR324 cluster bacterium]
MELIHKKFKSDSPEGEWVITIGNFDGYHIGHQALVRRVLADQEAMQIKGGLLTFDPHPKKLLQPEIPFRHLYDNQSKWKLLQETGLDACFIIPFTRRFASLSPQEFVDNLFHLLKLKKIIVGYDFNFGKAREGSADLMKREAARRGVEFIQMEPVKAKGITVSSTMIRRMIFEGDFEMVEQFLGRRWSVNGIIKRGQQIGRTIGFPTLNLEPDISLPLRKGVYACELELEGETYQGVCNVGHRPTFGGNLFKVETHVFDYDGIAYDQYLQVFPCHYIREEVKFDSPESLRQQIQEDVQTARQFFQ